MSSTLTPLDRMRSTVGSTRGPSAWRTITQEDINTFASVSGDDNWIHVDVERCERESPFGRPIAHGNLTLSVIDGLVMPLEVITDDDVEVGLNLGWNRVRFPAPVPVGSRLRVTAEYVSATDKGDGWWEFVDRYTVEIEGVEKPACVAENVSRLQFKDQ